jgi:hypothetical protein
VLTILLPFCNEEGWIGRGGVIRISAPVGPAIELESPVPDELALLIPGGPD